jgi:hypothetical protein
MNFYVDNIKVDLSKETGGLRLRTDDDNLLLANQTIEETRSIVLKNHRIVKENYEKLVNNLIDSDDISKVSMRIVLHYLYMYNLWRTMYKREEKRDLTFREKDFDHPYTKDKIIEYFKNKYPSDYSVKCETLLRMTTEDFNKYEKNRQDFYEMF